MHTAKPAFSSESTDQGKSEDYSKQTQSKAQQEKLLQYPRSLVTLVHITYIKIKTRTQKGQPEGSKPDHSERSKADLLEGSKSDQLEDSTRT